MLDAFAAVLVRNNGVIAVTAWPYDGSGKVKLKVMHHRLRGKLPSSTQLSNIMEKIDFIAVVGTLLQLLVNSQVIKKCLYSIIGFLPDRVAGIQA